MRIRLPNISLTPSLPRLTGDISLFGESSSAPMRRIVLLCLWGLLVFSLCLGTRLASDRIAAALADGLPPGIGLTLAARDVEPLAFPPGAHAAALTLGRPGKGPLLTLRDATMRLSLLSLITGRLGLDVSGTVGDGSLALTAAGGFLFDTDSLRLKARAEALPLSGVPALAALDKGLKGALDGTLSLSAPLAAPLTGEASASLVATDLHAINFIPLLTPKRLPPMDVELELAAADGALKVDRLAATGKNLEIMIQGGMGIDAEAPLRSTLDFDAKVRLPAAMVVKGLVRPEDYAQFQRGRAVDIRITGTPEAPRILGR